MFFNVIVFAFVSLIPVPFQALHHDAIPVQPPGNRIELKSSNSEHVVPRIRSDYKTELNLGGKCKLEWNDEIGSNEFPKSCDIELKLLNEKLTGKFVGPVLGSRRNSMFTGSIEGKGQNRLLLIQQHEQDYVCAYQAYWTGGAVTGTWHDTRNRSGSFRLVPENSIFDDSRKLKIQ